ncbi:hypothetical protein BDQ17DRAFT_239437 [Cyathus striatus]|nr:hypothetical protein BDQ17DRAFT_239437 [Cyathus striatus]
MLGVKSKAAAAAAGTKEKVKIPHASSSSSTSKGKAHDDDDDSPALVLEGRASVKHQGAFSWFWKERWLVLAGGVLSIKRSKTSAPTDLLPLPQLASLTRVVNSKRPFCLLLELRDGRRVFLSFMNDKELYAWNDAMYLCFAPDAKPPSKTTPKSPSKAPTAKKAKEGGVHHVHVGVDRDGEFTVSPFFTCSIWRRERN